MTITVIQAEAHGVTGTRPDGTPFLARSLEDVAPRGWYRLLRLPPGTDRARVLEFGRHEVGNRYGFLTIASIGIEKATPIWLHVPFRRPGTWVCSALGAEAVARGGWYHRWPDIYSVTPAEAMHALLESGAVEITAEEAQPGDVGFCHSAGFVGAAIRFAQRGLPDADINHMFIIDRRD